LQIIYLKLVPVGKVTSVNLELHHALKVHALKKVSVDCGITFMLNKNESKLVLVKECASLEAKVLQLMQH
jgi:hypothetical protein